MKDTNIQKQRQQALQNLRERRQERRNEEETGKNQQNSVNLESFFRLDWENEAENIELENQLAEIRLRLQKGKRINQDRQNQPTTLGEDTDSSKNRKELFKEILAGHFQNNIQSWISSVDPEPGFSSTPIEELEQYRLEVQYRYHLLKVMLEATQRELNDLELQIRMKKSVNS